MTRTYTFRDGGLNTGALRALNRAGAWAGRYRIQPKRLDPDAIVKDAIKQAGSDRFGSDSYREPLEVYCESAEREAQLSTFGRIAVRGMLVRSLTTRIEVAEWHAKNPEAAEEKIVRPWIIIGLPRTGTTLLSQLLALDPMARAPLQWETRTPVPPSTLSGAAEDPRIAACQKQLDGLAKLNPAVQAMHPFGAMLAEECVPFMMNDLRTLGMETQAFVPSYGRWLQACDMTPAYVQHKLALQALQVGQPTENWVLKTPNHLWALEELRAFYPDARLIWTHRDPGPVVTSLASLNTTLQRTFSSDVPHADIGADWKSKAHHAVDQGMAFEDARKAQGEEDWCVHVAYQDVMDDAAGVMRQIYAHFGDVPSGLHERRIERWLVERHQSVHGRHGYDPADFGWSWEGLAEEFSVYRERFGIVREKR